MNILIQAAAVVAAIGTIGGGVLVAESRYAPRNLVEDLVWSGMKREIRELRRDVEEGRAEQYELEELIDRFCRQYPDDRECG
jgi:hypothetical protein